MCDRLNRLLASWSGYFSYGTTGTACRAIDDHVHEWTRRFLVRRHKVQGRGMLPFSAPVVFGELGVVRLSCRCRSATPP